MERLVARIDNIVPTDTPARLGWERVQRVKVPRFGNVDVDKLGVSIYAGSNGKYGPSDGMHRLARVLDVRGLCQIEFTLTTGHEGYMDDIMDLTARDGIDTLETFLRMCKQGNFLRNDTA